MGNLAVAIVWYIVMTMLMALVAVYYDRWITAGHLDKDEGLTATAVMTSLLVALGVLGVEVARVLRLALLTLWLANQIGYPGWQTLVVLVGLWTIDSASAYAATGLTMIRGNCWREAMARREREAIGDERAMRTVEEATSYGYDAEGGGAQLEGDPGEHKSSSG